MKIILVFALLAFSGTLFSAEISDSDGANVQIMQESAGGAELESLKREIEHLHDLIRGLDRHSVAIQLILGTFAVILTVVVVTITLGATGHAKAEARDAIDAESKKVSARLEDEARAVFAKITKEHEYQLQAHDKLIAEKLENLQKIKSAEEKQQVADRAIKSEQKAEADRTPEDWLALAGRAFFQNDYEEAIKHLHRIIDSKDSNSAMVSRALVNKSYVLEVQGKVDDSLAACDEINRRFGSSQEPLLQVPLATALSRKGMLLDGLGQVDKAMAVYNEVEQRFGSSNQLEVQAAVAIVLLHKGNMLAKQSKAREAIAVYEKIDVLYSTVGEGWAQGTVAMALFQRGFMFDRLEKTEVAIDVYDEVARRYKFANESSLQGPAALALTNKGIALGRQGKTEEAIALYDEVDELFGKSEEGTLLAAVALALVNKGVALNNQGKAKNAIAVYDKIAQRFGDIDDVSVRATVARAIFNKGGTLFSQGEVEKARESFNEGLKKYGHADEAAIKSVVELARKALADLPPK